MKKIVLVILCLLFLALPLNALSNDIIRLYLDADMTGMKTSGRSIEQGIRTALHEVGNTLAGRKVELVVLDHRGNSERSRYNLERFLEDSDALAVFAGLHSPPLLAQRDFICHYGVLTLVPWAAAGPITRYANGTNWIFRLSVDDTKAGEVVVKRAVDFRGFKRLALVLENTGWGRSNLKTSTKALAARGLKPATLEWFDWGLDDAGAKILLHNIKVCGADAVYLVANASEAQAFIRAMIELGPEFTIPIISHWGITGGDFPLAIGVEQRKQIDLEFLQTSFSFLTPKQSNKAQKVLERAKKIFPDIRSAHDIKAPAGFIHAYDLTWLLIDAVRKAGLADPISDCRNRVRNALENLDVPRKGLVKIYKKPFRIFTPSDFDAHEALGADDLVFGRYGEANEIILIGR